MNLSVTSAVRHGFLQFDKLGYHAITACFATYLIIQLKQQQNKKQLHDKQMSHSSYISRIRNHL